MNFLLQSLFKKINAKYLINNQQFDTNSIKKYLFKLHGGKCFATIEKSIFQIGKLDFTMILIFYLAEEILL